MLLSDQACHSYLYRNKLVSECCRFNHTVIGSVFFISHSKFQPLCAAACGALFRWTGSQWTSLQPCSTLQWKVPSLLCYSTDWLILMVSHLQRSIQKMLITTCYVACGTLKQGHCRVTDTLNRLALLWRAGFLLAVIPQWHWIDEMTRNSLDSSHKGIYCSQWLGVATETMDSISQSR